MLAACYGKKLKVEERKKKKEEKMYMYVEKIKQGKINNKMLAERRTKISQKSFEVAK